MHRVRQSPVPRERGLQAFLEQHVERLAQPPDEVLGRGAEELHVELFAVHAPPPVPVSAAGAGGAAALQGARAHRGECESGRGHQPLLRPGHRHVHAPVVHPEVGGAERRDDVGHQQGGVAAGVEGAAHRRDVARHRGRGVGLHRQHRLDAMVPIRTQPLLDAARVECASPVAFQLLDLGAEVARELAPGPGEHAGGGHQHEIALVDEVHERGLPGAVAVGGVEEHPALRPEHPGEVGETRIGDGHEVGVDQVDGGAVHRGEHAVGDVGGPGGHQEVASAQEFRITHGRWFGCGQGRIGALPKKTGRIVRRQAVDSISTHQGCTATGPHIRGSFIHLRRITKALFTLPFDLNLGGSRCPVNSLWIPGFAGMTEGALAIGVSGAAPCANGEHRWIPAFAGMTVRTAYVRRPPAVIPAKAGIHDFGQPASRSAPYAVA